MFYIENNNTNYYFSAGKGVLVKIGPIYYYPARLIFSNPETKTWTVEMWRRIHNNNAGRIQDVKVSDIVDGLWKDQNGRRKIRVSNFFEFHIVLL